MQTRLVGNVHLVAGTAACIPQILELLKGEGMEVAGNPDIYIREYKYFSVDEARALRERASLRPVGPRRVFVVVAPDMNHNAQNALLKVLEEPAAEALFFFVVSAPETLLPTFRSRAQILVLEHAERAEHSIDAKAFLAAVPQERLEMLKPLLEKDEDDPEADAPRRNGAGKRDLGKIISFLSSLEKMVTKEPEALHAIYRARKYIGDKGALVKPLLEQVALLVPKI